MFNKIRRAKWFIPILAVLTVGLLVGGVFAAVTISNLWTSPTVTVTQGGGGGTPPRLPLVISSLDFTEPRSLFTGGSTQAGIRLQNPSPTDAPGYTGVVVQVTISKSLIVPSDVILQYSVDGGDTWLPIPLTQGTANTLVGTFGPTAGFPVGYNYDVTTPIKATFTTIGVYNAIVHATGN